MADGPGQSRSSRSRAVPFSTVNWSPFRLSRCRWGVQSGPLFDQQVVPFSFVKNNLLLDLAQRLVQLQANRRRDDVPAWPLLTHRFFWTQLVLQRDFFRGHLGV